MPLPISKSQLDLMGNRLKEEISNDDREMLRQVAGAYQEVLDDVKAQLAELGYAATTRVKTTATLVEKLRRERAMRLSQVQDLAGARIIVSDRPAQDKAKDKIRSYFESSGHACKEVDRRTHPTNGLSFSLIMRLNLQLMDALHEDFSAMLPQVRDRERELRDTLQLIANATAE
jgi:ppGpp synthetase/RelA/SpoT-type nucleotidyltranferase